MGLKIDNLVSVKQQAIDAGNAIAQLILKNESLTRMICELAHELLTIYGKLSASSRDEISKQKLQHREFSDLTANFQHSKGNRTMEVASAFALIFFASFFIQNQPLQQSLQFIGQQIGKPANEFFMQTLSAEEIKTQNRIQILLQEISSELNKNNDQQQRADILQLVQAGIRVGG
jgi:hypothetical protein